MKPTQQEIIEQLGEAFDRAVEICGREFVAKSLLERFGASGGEPVAWPAGSAQLHISLLNMGKAMAKERSREIGDAWNQLADLLALLAKSRDTHPSPTDLHAEYLRGLEDAAKVCEDLPAAEIFTRTEATIWDVATLDCAEAIRTLKGKQ